MSISGIQGQVLEVTVVCCNKLKDTEWISRQDPYVCVEYGSTRFRTRTCTDGGKNPTFQEKFVFTLIEGLRELSVSVYNSNTMKHDDFIGNGKIQLQKVLSQNYDDSSWSIQSSRGRFSGEVRVIMHNTNANVNKPAKNQAPSAPSHTSVPAPHAPLYSAPPSVTYPQTGYPAPPLYPSYPPYSAGHPSTTYPPASYPPAYPPAAYPQVAYPPHPTYPPPPQDPHHYPPGSYPQSLYPPPPY